MWESMVSLRKEKQTRSGWTRLDTEMSLKPLRLSWSRARWSKMKRNLWATQRLRSERSWRRQVKWSRRYLERVLRKLRRSKKMVRASMTSNWSRLCRRKSSDIGNSFRSRMQVSSQSKIAAHEKSWTKYYPLAIKSPTTTSSNHNHRRTSASISQRVDLNQLNPVQHHIAPGKCPQTVVEASVTIREQTTASATVIVYWWLTRVQGTLTTKGQWQTKWYQDIQIWHPVNQKRPTTLTLFMSLLHQQRFWCFVWAKPNNIFVLLLCPRKQ